jgi:hypothetical protein
MRVRLPPRPHHFYDKNAGQKALVITRHDRCEVRRFGMGVATRVLAHLVKEDPGRAARLTADEVPWLTCLPESERDTCVQDLVANLGAGADTGTLEPFSRAVKEWQDTAEVWSGSCRLVCR